jgi:hypothetical protein
MMNLDRVFLMRLMWTVGQFSPKGPLALLGMAACVCAVAPSALSAQTANPLVGIKRVYVEAFPAKAGSEKLREDLVAQLRKLSFTMVTSEADADVIVAGNGETWIKGYRSLNPRSGRSPSNGEPVYAGYLSVELKDAMGETLWSYLVTLGPDSENITKDLSKQIAKHLTEALK